MDETALTLSTAAQDYLKTIYLLRGEGLVTTQSLADKLAVAPPSATAMVKKLAALHLVAHAPYRGVELTPAGEKIALEMVRHHRLIETYLAEVLGLSWDKVHDEAERWEHVISEEVEAKIAAALGHPSHDPHGSPIPTLNGEIAHDDWLPLSQMEAGAQVIVRRVDDDSAELLRHVQEVGLVPGTGVEILRAVPAEGVLQLRVGGKKRTIGLIPAQAIFVEDQGEK
ncbi:MAG TPA: metal-dependent transcriptional regulator [Abditibacteriaceae bacterium]